MPTVYATTINTKYDTVGLPFLCDLGQRVYETELRRQRPAR
ncbi:MAG: hypothetical protein ACRYFK_05885 [Janthinobacterium lividum]